MSARIETHGHLLIAGHCGSGKTSLVRHLLARECADRPVTVVDALGKGEYERVADRDLTYVSGHGNGEMAVWAIQEALTTPGSILVVEDADLIIGVYAEQHLLTVGSAVERAILVGTSNDIAVIATTQRVSAETAGAFRSRVLLTSGREVSALDWVAFFGAAPLPAAVAPGLGTGYLRDGCGLLRAVAFDFDTREQGC